MTDRTIDALRDAHGRFSMLAIDQRGSLRAMLEAANPGTTASDAELVAFKVEVARALTPKASAILLDRAFGADAAAVSQCPVILAADILSASIAGGDVDHAELDEEVTAEVATRFGAAALKMLVPWTEETRDAAVELSDRFMALCRTLGLPGIVEGVVRPADIRTWAPERRNDALVAAAADLAPTKPDLYKGEVPSFGVGPREAMVETAQRITAVLDSPWVVLSSGVTADDFPGAVAACREGGAEGFLAGRAIWADAVRAADPEEFLRTTSAQRLERLASA